VCPEWNAQQKILWGEVRKETGRAKDGGRSGTSWRTRGAGERHWTSSPPRMYHVGRRVWAQGEAVSEMSEAELREFLEEQGAGAGQWGATTVPPHA